jgi:hypothetical protein
MKNILLLLITILISACSSTKQVTEIALNKPIEKVVVINDSIFENNKSTIVYKETSQDSLKRKPEFVSKHANRGLVKETIEIHELWNELLQEHVSDKGNVDYQGLIKERLKLNNYIKLLNPELPNGTHKKEYTLAFWINAYNAMTVDLILRHYPVKSIKDIKDPWQQRYWKLGEKWFNLEDIEHQILRKMEEPRIHFAIVCASISCPKLLNEAYTAENLEQQLTNATKDFLSDTKRNFISKDTLELSKIFQWFTKDFKQNGSLIDFLNLYSNIEISIKAKTNYQDYNWDLNE